MIAALALVAAGVVFLLPAWYFASQDHEVRSMLCSLASQVLFCAAYVTGFLATGSLVDLAMAVFTGVFALVIAWFIWRTTRRRRKRAIALAGAKTRAVLHRMLAALKPQPAPRIAKAPAGAP